MAQNSGFRLGLAGCSSCPRVRQVTRAQHWRSRVGRIALARRDPLSKPWGVHRPQGFTGTGSHRFSRHRVSRTRRMRSLCGDTLRFELLGQRGPTVAYRLALIALLGFGWSPEPRTTYSIERHVTELHRVLSNRRPLTLVGPRQ